jgi:hypothetical protein
MELFPQNFDALPLVLLKQGIYWYIKWYQLTNQISLLSKKQVNVCDKPWKKKRKTVSKEEKKYANIRTLLFQF